MRDLLEVEYNQKSLLYILKRLEASYGNEQEEKWIANSAGYYLEALQKELRGAISRLDAYVAEKAENPASFPPPSVPLLPPCPFLNIPLQNPPFQDYWPMPSAYFPDKENYCAQSVR